MGKDEKEVIKRTLKLCCAKFGEAGAKVRQINEKNLKFKLFDLLIDSRQPFGTICARKKQRRNTVSLYYLARWKTNLNEKTRNFLIYSILLQRWSFAGTGGNEGLASPLPWIPSF
jgi:hypothetical protein